MFYEDVQTVLTNVTTGPPTMPSESQLVLLCLDYLRDLRRAFSTEPDDLLVAEGIDGDYITLAIWALSRSFVRPKELQIPSEYPCVSEEVQKSQAEALQKSARERINLSAWGNDPMFDLEHADPTLLKSRNRYEDFENVQISDRIHIPDLHQMEKEVIYPSCPNLDKRPGNEGKYNEDYQMYPVHWYEHDEMHHSNSHRFYIYGGLNNGPPLSLAELASAGLSSLKARSRLDADKDITASPIFTQFVKAVEAKGFFNIDDEEMTEELYNERFNKVVAKFRSKLANKAKQQILEKEQGHYVDESIQQSEFEDRQLPLPVYREQSPNYEDYSTSETQLPVETVKNHGSIQHSKMRSPQYTTPPRKQREEQRQVNTSKQQPQRTPPLYRQNNGNSHFIEGDKKFMTKLQKQEQIESPYYANKEKSRSKPRAQHAKSHQYETREESRDDSISYGLETSRSHNRQSKDWDDDHIRDAVDHDFVSKSKSESDFSERHNADISRSMSRSTSKRPSSRVSGRSSKPRASSLSRSFSMDRDTRNKSNSKRSSTLTPRRREKQKDTGERQGFKYNHRPSESQSTFSEFDKGTKSSEFEEIANVNTDDQSTLEMEKAEQLKTNGNKHMQNRDYKSAIEAYTAALLISPVGPNSHVYFSNRAAAYLSSKKFNEAISDSKRSLALKPKYGKAHSRLGLAHFLLGEYKEAAEAYTNAVANEPNNKTSQSYLEKARKKLEEQADIDKRKTEKEKRIRKGESNKKTTRPVSRSNSRIKERSSSRVRSLRKFDDEVSTVGSLSNKSFFTSEERATHLRAEKYKIEGNAYVAAKKYEAAVRSYSNALLESSDGIHSHVYYSNRSAALCYLECYEDAEQDALASIELHPKYAKAHARLGLSRYSQGNYIGAISAYEDSLRYDPDNEAAQIYLEKSKAKLVKQQKRTEGRR